MDVWTLAPMSLNQPTNEQVFWDKLRLNHKTKVRSDDISKYLFIKVNRPKVL